MVRFDGFSMWKFILSKYLFHKRSDQTKCYVRTNSRRKTDIEGASICEFAPHQYAKIADIWQKHAICKPSVYTNIVKIRRPYYENLQYKATSIQKQSCTYL